MTNYTIKLTEMQIKKIKFAIEQEVLKYDEWISSLKYDEYISENEKYTAKWLFEERKEWNDILRYLKDLPF